MGRFLFVTSAATLSAVIATLVGCGESKPPARSATQAAPSADANRTSASRTASPQGPSNVTISDEIRSKCGIPDEDAYFAFDSAHVRAQDHSPLDLVASCFVQGALRGHVVKLVGRADPRGETEYNMTLGQSRADAVGNYLVSRGMPSSKTKSTSRGAMDATGSDESSWQHDRRVDVMLGN